MDILEYNVALMRQLLQEILKISDDIILSDWETTEDLLEILGDTRLLALIRNDEDWNFFSNAVCTRRAQLREQESRGTQDWAYLFRLRRA